MFRVGIFFTVLSMFYSIVYNLGNIPEIFITRQREKATRCIDLDTQHDLLETNRAGPKFRELGPARPGRSAKLELSGPARGRPGPFSALLCIAATLEALLKNINASSLSEG
jgi:hypothetical protein